ncbi:MAG: hypothetical protein IH857_00655 [Deltaproteobacteria bacterium]|nr:hypothetical protein [Deltaproteobacteria bacterium]
MARAATLAVLDPIDTPHQTSDNHQMHERDEIWESGATGLWLAVLMIAVEDVRGRRLSIGSLRGRLSSYSAKQWFQSSSSDPGGFVWICEILNLKPEWVLRLALGSSTTASVAAKDGGNLRLTA